MFGVLEISFYQLFLKSLEKENRRPLVVRNIYQATSIRPKHVFIRNYSRKYIHEDPILGMQDFNYLATNAFEITLELGCQKYTPEKELEKEWIRNKDALLAFIWKAHTGVKGIVSDDSGFIQNAIISVVNITGPVPRPIRHDITTGTFYNIRFFLLLSLYFISYLCLNRFLTMRCTAK